MASIGPDAHRDDRRDEARHRAHGHRRDETDGGRAERERRHVADARSEPLHDELLLHQHDDHDDADHAPRRTSRRRSRAGPRRTRDRRWRRSCAGCRSRGCAGAWRRAGCSTSPEGAQSSTIPAMAPVTRVKASIGSAPSWAPKSVRFTLTAWPSGRPARRSCASDGAISFTMSAGHPDLALQLQVGRQHIERRAEVVEEQVDAWLGVPGTLLGRDADHLIRARPDAAERHRGMKHQARRRRVAPTAAPRSRRRGPAARRRRRRTSVRPRSRRDGSSRMRDRRSRAGMSMTPSGS